MTEGRVVQRRLSILNLSWLVLWLVLWLVFLLSFVPYVHAQSLQSTVKYWPIQEVAIVELVGINEQVDASEYSASVAIALAGSGSIQKVCIITSESGSGAILTPAINLFFLDADPISTAGDAGIPLAERDVVFAQIALASADYQADATGAINCQAVDEEYHDVGGTAYVLFFLNAAETSINNLAGDDELIRLHLWYRKDK